MIERLKTVLKSSTSFPDFLLILKNTEYASLSTDGFKEQSFSHNSLGNIGYTLWTKYVEVHLS